MLLIEGGMVYDHDGDTDHPPRADILIEANRIVAVGRNLRGDPRCLAARGLTVIDASDRLVIPGFVNGHYHSHDALLKGFFETLPVELWAVLALPPAFPRRNRRELRARTLIGAVECLYGGITTVQDMDRVHPFDDADIDVVLQAYDDIGIRCIFAPHVTETSPLDTTAFWRETIAPEDQWRVSGPAGPLLPKGVDTTKAVADFIRPRIGRHARISFGVGPSSPDRLTLRTLQGLADFARAENLPYYIHLNESRSAAVQGMQQRGDHGGSHVRFLADAGILGSTTSVAHSVWLNDAEIDLLAQSETTACLCPVGNLKTRSGAARSRAMMRAGVNLALGCDNCSCSDAQNMFQAMKMFCGLAAISDPMPGPPGAADALRAATLGGGRPAGMADLGALKPGMLADLVLLDLGDPSFVPFNSAARQIVYAEAGRGVRTVIVDGRVVFEGGRVTTIDERALRAEIGELMIALTHDAAEVSARIAPIKDAILAAVRRSWEMELPIHPTIGRTPVW